MASTLPDLTVSTVCLRQYDLAQALDVAAGLGFASVDFVGLRGLCEHAPVNGDDAQISRAARELIASGLRPVSINADPGSFDGADDADDVHRKIDRMLQLAVDVSAPILVLPAGEKSDERTADPQIARMADALNLVAVRGREAGVRIAVEAPYFGRPIDRIARAESLLQLLDPAVELAFDVSHIEGAGESVLDAWQLFSSRVAIVHLRDAVVGNIRRVIGAGQVDFAGFFAAMTATGFGGDIVLELETRDSPYASKEEEVTAAVAYLETITNDEKELVR
jgi:sugar phosphate isomerase/epimerase